MTWEHYLIFALVLLLIIKETLMATKNDVTNAIANLKTKLLAAVSKELDEIKAQIQKLKEAVENGGAATAADLDAFVTALDEVGTSVPAAIDGVSTQDGAEDGPVGPAISALSPDTVNHGRADFTLNVNGVGFKPDHKVAWNFNVLETVFVDETRLKATVTADLYANAQTAIVSVFENNAPVASKDFVVS